VLGNGIVRPVR